jgi:hypothetical protein
MVASLQIDPLPAEKTLGYFTLHEHTVDIESAGGTIKMTLPRMGQGHPLESSEIGLKRIWPVDSPEYTPKFLRWVARVVRATDWGTLPPSDEEKRHAAWIEKYQPKQAKQ